MRRESRSMKAVLVLFCIIILLPAATLIIWTFTERWAWPDLLPQVYSLRALREVLSRKEQLFSLLISSFIISLLVGMFAVIIGLMTTRALTLYEFRGRGIMNFLAILPFIVPATVFAMGVQVSFIKMGLNNTVLGVVITHLIYSLPYAIQILMEPVKAVGTGLEEQARVLGASPFKAFYKVTLPVLVPVMLSAASMSYIISFSQYFLTLLIGGGRIKTFTIVMVPYLQSGDRNIACIYSILFLGVTLIIFGIFRLIAAHLSNRRSAEFYT